MILTKHHGLGNDFLIARLDSVGDTAQGTTTPGLDADRFAMLARRLCDRRRGIGADGLAVLSEADGHHGRMTLFNADGSRAEMSGNGIRCFAQALAMARGEQDLEATFLILTDAGSRHVELRPTTDPSTIDATVDMGEVTNLDAPRGWETIGVHPDRPVAHLSLGNPHTVVGVDDIEVVDLEALGTRIAQVNLEIVEPGAEPGSIRMRVHERGVGITEACGTGACAAAWAARRWGMVPSGITEIRVHMDGGSATVGVDRPQPGRVMLTGPATYVATISIEAS